MVLSSVQAVLVQAVLVQAVLVQVPLPPLCTAEQGNCPAAHSNDTTLPMNCPGTKHSHCNPSPSHRQCSASDGDAGPSADLPPRAVRQWQQQKRSAPSLRDVSQVRIRDSK